MTEEGYEDKNFTETQIVTDNLGLYGDERLNNKRASDAY